MQGENPVKMKAEVYRPECRKLPPNHQKLGGGGEQILLHGPQTLPIDALISDFSHHNRVTITFCCMSPQTVVRFTLAGSTSMVD